ncbi:TlpA family protein disulfide reductase [Patiriisocius marinus]|uniref:TlpA family protein disulfide reductase n=1 Tax=Patiriisocius marinus TaxID=1397112 RepID=UPI002330ACCF|nr:TlpA disulfide reductase family protein [Patiriisocius marinus]
MRIGFLFSVLLIPFYFGMINSNITTTVVTSFDKNKTIPVYDFEELEPLLYTNDDKVYIVNFWAMWCAPCVKELPVIQEYEKNNPNVEVLLVSLDFAEDIETKLIPFLDNKGITSKVVLLDDPDANNWIDKIDPTWSGSIPFTIVFDKNNRSFHERAFNTLQDLENVLIQTTKNN